MVCAVVGLLALRARITVLGLCLLAAITAAPAPAQTPGEDLLRIPFPQYDGGLTPYTFELGYPLMTLVYDTLLWRDAEGVPRPWLAKSVTRSRGGSRVTVRLRSGARWHDGRPVTAEDVAVTFRYMADHRQPRFTPQLADVVSVRATGRLTATFDLRRPSLGFEQQPLADVPILPRHLWENLPPGRQAPAGLAVGSGPYRLTQASRKDGYRLRANTRYELGAPRVAQLRVPIFSDAEKTYDALRERDVEMVPLNLPRAAAGSLDRALGIIVRRGVSYLGTALVMNTRRSPFDDARARAAVAASLDLGRIVRNVAPAQEATAGFLHPEAAWAPDAAVHRTDVAAARRTFAALNLPRIRVLAPDNNPARTEAGRQVVLALRRAGATATLVEIAPGQLSKALGEDGSTPDFSIAIGTITPLVSEDPDYLRALFGSRSAPLNVSGYSSDAFNAAAARVGSAPDRAAREHAILDEQRLLARAAPMIPLFFAEGAYAYRDSIYDGWRYIKGTGVFDKRSLLSLGEPVIKEDPGQADAAVADDVDSGSGIGVFDVLTVLALLAITGLAGFALLQRRSSR